MTRGEGLKRAAAAVAHEAFKCIRYGRNEDRLGGKVAAEHLLNDADAVLAWTLRYQDTWRRHDGAWRFTHRKIVIDWEETRPVKPGA